MEISSKIQISTEIKIVDFWKF